MDEFGAPFTALSPTDFATPGIAYTAGLPPLRFDILTRVAGATFAAAYKNRTKVKLAKLVINYVALDLLIKIKTKAGRPQDKADVVKLKSYKD